MPALSAPTDAGTLARLRIEAGWEQHDVAELLGVSQATVSRWESGTHQPRPRHRNRMAKLYRLSDAQLGDAVALTCRLSGSTVPGYRSRRPCGRMAQFFRRWRRRPDDTDLALAA